MWREQCRSIRRRGVLRPARLVVARVAGTAAGPTLASIGHIDEIGVHITHIDDDGFLRFGQVGGWDAVVLAGQRMRLLTRDGVIAGVISRKPVHSLGDDERRKAPELKELHIDIGARSAEEARQHVRIGDVGVIAADPVELSNGRIVGPGARQPRRLLRRRRVGPARGRVRRARPATCWRWPSSRRRPR